ncbi:hypothetical protein VTI74DRAFT_1651 [Chaetomium olivicolor]
MPPRCCGVSIFPVDTFFVTREHPILRLLDAASQESWVIAVRRAREVASADMHVDREVVRLAKRAKGANLFQFCQRCHRLVTRSEGCNHMTCICGHEFCVICGKTWPVTIEYDPDEDGPQPGLCHKFFGEEDKHVLRIPPQVQERLDAEAELPPPATAEDKEGILCNHDPDIVYCLRLRRDMDDEERERARCDVCGKAFKAFKAFLLQCRGCGTLLCLECRDRLWDEEDEEREDAIGGDGGWCWWL